jgi:hypothetical protein
MTTLRYWLFNRLSRISERIERLAVWLVPPPPRLSEDDDEAEELIDCS